MCVWLSGRLIPIPSTVSMHYSAVSVNTISLDDAELEALEDSLTLSAYSSTDDRITTLKKFIFKLVVELHHAGNLTFRTEDYIRKVTEAYNLHSTCAILPSCAILTFHESAQLSPATCSSYCIRIRYTIKISLF